MGKDLVLCALEAQLVPSPPKINLNKYKYSLQLVLLGEGGSFIALSQPLSPA